MKRTITGIWMAAALVAGLAGCEHSLVARNMGNAYRENMAAALSVRKLVFDGLGPVDLVFFLLGVVTAFQMTQGESPAQQEQEAPARTQVAAAPREREREEEKEAEPQV